MSAGFPHHFPSTGSRLCPSCGGLVRMKSTWWRMVKELSRSGRSQPEYWRLHTLTSTVTILLGAHYFIIADSQILLTMGFGLKRIEHTSQALRRRKALYRSSESMLRRVRGMGKSSYLHALVRVKMRSGVCGGSMSGYVEFARSVLR
ncbi:hypothetical protein L227DRAFT_228199 [Lentinus tigrinus ALCF2SS1-6]|uniref:Uncharacterized protein n=1 Tax=Lentinus tigrinus ALCF2SS1-6 TaxID=1328759 RepID=A0A5C2S1K2_9APHY|nr:hypothetical protein L227DRAFT_228199 [Lentinus tigrinus ALCF2SS1-6]